MKKIYLLIIFCGFMGMLIPRKAHAQDPVFSQWFNAPMLLNPALASQSTDMEFTSSFRSQWSNIDLPYATTQASLTYPIFKGRRTRRRDQVGGVGINFYNDISGMNNNFRVLGGSLNFAYNVLLDNQGYSRITFGLKTGFGQKRIDTGNLQWGEQYQPFVGFDQSIVVNDVLNIENRTFFDAGAGVFYEFKPNPRIAPVLRYANAGYSVDHLNHPNESVIAGQVNRLPLVHRFHGESEFVIDRNSSVSAKALVLFQRSMSQFNIGAHYNYRVDGRGMPDYFKGRASAGVWYRVQDSFIFLTQFETDMYRIGISYDANASSLRFNNRGASSIEFSIALKFSPASVGLARNR
ncbi:MAG: PorP/SprF family type IX secretion system membrane protein [Cyclobacteriaceae bacterium]|nr:PorP/SprF family type IX secretion system membrane protein [Cyclobacteriaceae bacterium]MCH8516651.1 PorP/SprF family type IX secretion system membrane protein [Cyclobacteriaceae bacterium]